MQAILMIKKILAFAASALLSLHASAGYIQYELRGPNYDPAEPESWTNTLVIREEDKSVADYSIDGFRPQERYEGYYRNRLIETTTSFTGLGPTNMYMWSMQPEEFTKQMWLLFSEGPVPGTFNFTLRVLSRPGPQSAYPELGPWSDITYSGTARQVELNPYYDWWLGTDPYILQRDVPYFDPTQVPEPGTLALLGIGVLGAAGSARRRKTYR